MAFSYGEGLTQSFSTAIRETASTTNRNSRLQHLQSTRSSAFRYHSNIHLNRRINRLNIRLNEPSNIKGHSNLLLTASLPPQLNQQHHQCEIHIHSSSNNSEITLC